MSIMPKGGWGDVPSGGSVQGTAAARSYLTCKVCDTGTLSLKSVFRMSGPAVAIGFILLIPSILGIAFSLFILFASNAPNINSAGGASSRQTSFEASFRRSCASRFTATRSAAGFPTSSSTTEQYCECALSEYRLTGSASSAGQSCFDRLNAGVLDTPSPETDVLYSNQSARHALGGAETSLARIFGSAFAITLGITCFVGGLLGWLLVMKKRILHCDTCGAAVSAS
jgi:hypothetical protein